MNNGEFLKLMQERHSCRDFDPNKPVDKELLVKMVETAKLSPSACNSQPYEIFIAQGDAAKAVADAKMANFNKYVDDCPAFIIITEDSYNLPEKIGSLVKNVDFRAIDIGILCANLVNSAKALGLDSCILGIFDEKKLQKLINRRTRVRLVLAIGYPKADCEVRARKRKTFDENVCFL